MSKTSRLYPPKTLNSTCDSTNLAKKLETAPKKKSTIIGIQVEHSENENILKASTVFKGDGRTIVKVVGIVCTTVIVICIINKVL